MYVCMYACGMWYSRYYVVERGEKSLLCHPTNNRRIDLRVTIREGAGEKITKM